MSPRHRFDIVLNNLAAWAVTTGRIHLKSDGTPWRPLVHIEDISRAFLAVLEAPREAVHAEVFNVGRTDENFQIRQIAEIVGETVPNCEIEFAEGAGPDTRSYRVSFEKIARQVPAFRPKWTVRDGARELYEAYRKSDLRLEDFEGPEVSADRQPPRTASLRDASTNHSAGPHRGARAHARLAPSAARPTRILYTTKNLVLTSSYYPVEDPHRWPDDPDPDPQPHRLPVRPRPSSKSSEFSGNRDLRPSAPSTMPWPGPGPWATRRS